MGWKHRAAFGVVAVLVLAALPASAADEEEQRPARTNRVEAVREWATSRLEECFEALEREDYAAARIPLDDMRKRKRRLNDHEEAIMWQAYGYLFVGQERYRNAAKALELAIGMNAMAEAQQQSTRFDLGQLYMISGDWDRAVTTLLRWYEEERDPTPNAEYMIALALAQNERWDEAFPHAQRSVEGEAEPRESWLQLLLQVYYERGDQPGMLPVLQRLIELYPKKEHWLRLYALYNELGEESKALAALEVAYADGLLTQQSELVDLARLYAYHELPYRGAQVIAQGIEEGLIEPDHDVWELLANNWLQAREHERALEPLARAAESDATGQTYVRLAQVYIERADWEPAREALAKALQRGGLDEPGQVHLLLGIASFGGDEPSAARRSFELASRYDATRDVAIKWIEHVDQRQKQRQSQSAS